tara:strand:- start:33890 stop:34102 length:213 start_codon:yes stop_codon:yes gene_type:complete
MDIVYLKENNNINAEIKDLLQKEINNNKKDHLNIISNKHTLDSSLHSFDPNKSSPPNDFFIKSHIRLKRY